MRDGVCRCSSVAPFAGTYRRMAQALIGPVTCGQREKLTRYQA
jgi:hypothetical protein